MTLQRRNRLTSWLAQGAVGSAEGRSPGPSVLQRSLAGGELLAPALPWLCSPGNRVNHPPVERRTESPSLTFHSLKSPRLFARCRGLQTWFALCMVLEGLLHSDVCGRLILQFRQRAEGRKCFLGQSLQPWLPGELGRVLRDSLAWAPLPGTVCIPQHGRLLPSPPAW